MIKRPMLAVLTDKPFDDPEWIFEIKWDGFRAIAETENGKVRLYSRNQKDLSADFPMIIKALKLIKHKATFDGEIVALGKNGLPSFQLLQRRMDTAPKVAFVIFDILKLDGKSLLRLPIIDRKDILKRVLPADKKVLIFGDYIKTQGKKFFKKAKALGLEGIMAKRIDSPYLLGERSPLWLKIKTHLRQEAVIVGFTAPQGSRSRFGSLVLAVKERGKWTYVGHCGTGFDQQALDLLIRKMKPLMVSKSPFDGPVPTKSPITWVRPRLVAEIQFAQWTNEGHMRVPVYLGLRSDKKAGEVRREKPKKKPSK